MLDFKLYMRTAAYPRIRSEYRWERWLRIAYWFVRFSAAKRTERLWLGKSVGIQGGTEDAQ